MGEKKLLDLVQATGEETVDITLSTVLPEVVKAYGDIVVSEGVATIAGELVGAICPRLNNIRLSYKQNRLERNVAIMLQRLIDNNQVLSDRITVLEQSMEGKKLINQSGEMLLDNIVDEIQPEKVKYSVNGYVNILQTEDANMDMALMFFKTIAQLNEIDIHILQNYDWRDTSKHDPEPINLSDFDYEHLLYIKEKLLRFGLLRSRNQGLINENQKIIIEYLQKAYKDATSRKPKGVKIPNFKKISRTDSYRITSLGMALLQLISEQCDMSDLTVPNDNNEDDGYDEQEKE